ncbi:MAG: DUF3185 domain-containing protein [Planctomycetota bacterium]|nr:MAG: DUF3185 domain-containing protein [Planctomycetota bacterium]
MNAKGLLIVGVVLIVAGAAALIMGGITYTEQETVVDVGGLNVKAEREKRIPVPPIAGGIALAAGAVCVALGLKKK